MLGHVDRHAMEIVENNTHMLLDKVVIEEVVVLNAHMPHWQIDLGLTVVELEKLRRSVHVGTDIVVTPQANFNVEHLAMLLRTEIGKLVFSVRCFGIYGTQNCRMQCDTAEHVSNNGQAEEAGATAESPVTALAKGKVVFMRKADQTHQDINLFSEVREALQHAGDHHETEGHSYNSHASALVAHLYEGREVIGEVVDSWFFIDLIEAVHAAKAGQVGHSNCTVAVEYLSQTVPPLQARVVTIYEHNLTVATLRCRKVHHAALKTIHIQWKNVFRWIWWCFCHSLNLLPPHPEKAIFIDIAILFTLYQFSHYYRSMKKKQIAIFVILIAVVAAGFWWLTRDNGDKTTSSGTKKSSSQSTTSKTTEVPASFDKSKYSLTDPTSIWVIANKQHPLNPKTYAPSDLVVPTIPLRSTITSTEKQVRQPMATALESMVAAAKSEGLGLNLQSGYRSYSFQVSLYNRYVQQQGQAVADSQSARPGYSEHQTGLAADLGSVSHPECDVEACFGTTPEGKWLAANAYKYGFIIRYPQNMQNITGYIYEPWHVRYIGVDLATEMHNTNVQTLEQFFGTGAAADY